MSADFRMNGTRSMNKCGNRGNKSFFLGRRSGINGPSGSNSIPEQKKSSSVVNQAAGFDKNNDSMFNSRNIIVEISLHS